MLISIVKNHPVNLRIGKESWESSWRWQISLATNVEPSEEELCSQEILKSYCKQIRRILGVRKIAAINKDDVSSDLCIHFRMSPTFPTKTCIRLHGKLLEKLLQLCGKDTKIILEVNFNELIQGGGGGNIPGQIANFNKQYKTLELVLQEELEVTKNPIATPTNGSCSNLGAFCDDIEIPLPENFIDTCNNHRAKSDIVSNMTVSVWFAIDDLCLNHSCDALQKLRSTCSNMITRQLHTDASIVCSNGSVLQCHRSYLAVSSSIFASMLGDGSKDAKAVRIEMPDISEDCVKAMLAYLYTLDATMPFQCSILAVELFQLAHKYEIVSLEEHLVDMFTKKASKWYDVNSALDLYRFSRSIEKYAELKIQMIHVLKSKGKLLTESENYRKLFVEEPAAAMEMCSIALTE